MEECHKKGVFIIQLSDEEILAYKTKEGLLLDQLPGNYMPNLKQAKEIAAEMVRTLDIWISKRKEINDNNIEKNKFSSKA